MSEISEYATPAGAAKTCGLTRDRVSRWIRDGHVPTDKLGCGQIVVRLADVQRLVDNPLKRGPAPATTDAS